MNSGYYFSCGSCGTGKMKVARGAYRADAYEVPDAEFLQCDQCSAISLTPEQATALQARIAATERASKGLLAPNEIVELRELLGNITQADLEELLGTGPKTVSRWERGTVCQNAKANLDMLAMRVLARNKPGISLKFVAAVLRDLPNMIEQVVADRVAALVPQSGIEPNEIFEQQTPASAAKTTSEYAVTSNSMPAQKGLRNDLRAAA